MASAPPARCRPRRGSSARRPGRLRRSVNPRTRVTVGIDGVAAPLALRAAGSDKLVGVVAEGGGLAARHVEPDVPAVVIDLVLHLVVLVVEGRGDQLLELDEE